MSKNRISIFGLGGIAAVLACLVPGAAQPKSVTLSDAQVENLVPGPGENEDLEATEGSPH